MRFPSLEISLTVRAIPFWLLIPCLFFLNLPGYHLDTSPPAGFPLFLSRLFMANGFLSSRRDLHSSWRYEGFRPATCFSVGQITLRTLRHAFDEILLRDAVCSHWWRQCLKRPSRPLSLSRPSRASPSPSMIPGLCLLLIFFRGSRPLRFLYKSKLFTFVDRTFIPFLFPLSRGPSDLYRLRSFFLHRVTPMAFPFARPAHAQKFFPLSFISDLSEPLTCVAKLFRTIKDFSSSSQCSPFYYCLCLPSMCLI